MKSALKNSFCLFIALLIELGFMQTDNFAMAVNVKKLSELQVDLALIKELNDEQRALLREVLDSRQAYVDLLKSLQSYNMIIGYYTYSGPEKIRERYESSGYPPALTVNPSARHFRLKQMEDRTVTYEVSRTNVTQHRINDEMKWLKLKLKEEWILFNGSKDIGITSLTQKLNSGENLIHLSSAQRGYDREKYSYDPNLFYPPWDFINERPIENVVNGFAKNYLIVIDELRETTYENKRALVFSIVTPGHDGGFKGIYSLEPGDYGQLLYMHRRTGCRDCAGDPTKRAVVREIELRNIQYEYLTSAKVPDLKFPIPVFSEYVHYKNDEVYEIIHYNVFDASFDSIESEDELRIPFENDVIYTDEGKVFKETIESGSHYLSPYFAFGDEQLAAVRQTEIDADEAEQLAQTMSQQQKQNGVDLAMLDHVKEQSRQYIAEAQPSLSALPTVSQLAFASGSVLVLAGLLLSLRIKRRGHQ